MSILRKMPWLNAKPTLKLIAILVQHSADFVLSLPGSKLMTPGSDSLEHVLQTPDELPKLVYLPVVGDYHHRLSSEHGLPRRWAERGIDRIIKLFLGAHHDWVVGTAQQYIMPADHYPNGWPGKWDHRRLDSRKRIITARHSEYFPSKKANVGPKMSRFLASGKAW